LKGIHFKKTCTKKEILAYSFSTKISSILN